MPITYVRVLEDDFEMFPLERALRELGRVIERLENDASELSDPVSKWYGAPYRSIPLEMHVEALSMLVGASFVTGQAMINRTVRLLERMRENGAATIPQRRRQLLEFESEFCDGIAVIQGINDLANFFKHHDEWEPDWTGPRTPNEANTVAVVRTLGLSPQNPDNILIGSRALGLGSGEGLATRIADRVGDWRKRLATRLRNDLGLGPEFNEEEDAEDSVDGS